MSTYAESSVVDSPMAITMESDDTNVKVDEGIVSMDTDDDRPLDQPEGGEGGDQEDQQQDVEVAISDEEMESFDPEDEEQVAKFDQAFTMEDGSINDEALSAVFWKRQEAKQEGLPEGVYAYLESKGIRRSLVKQIEAMSVTEADAKENSVVKHDEALFEEAGGADVLRAALEWGRNGGYTKEQQERFNKITAGTDLEAKKEAVAALMARYHRANPPKRPKVPGRDATKGGGGKPSTALPFKNREEMRKMRDSLKPNDHAGWALYRRRRAASNF